MFLNNLCYNFDQLSQAMMIIAFLIGFVIFKFFIFTDKESEEIQKHKSKVAEYILNTCKEDNMEFFYQNDS